MSEPPLEIPDPAVPGDPSPNSLAAKELQEFSEPHGWWYVALAKHEKSINISLKILLFVVVIGMNLWWTHRVLQLVFDSAYSRTQYRLSDSVLIALVTTSLANFIALVAIVARHLFPNPK